MRCTLTRSLADRWAWARGFFRDCEGGQNCGNQTIREWKLGSHVGRWPWDCLSQILTTWPADREKADTWARATLNTQPFIFEGAGQAGCQQFRVSMCYLQSNKHGLGQYRHADCSNAEDLHTNGCSWFYYRKNVFLEERHDGPNMRQIRAKNREVSETEFNKKWDVSLLR